MKHENFDALSLTELIRLQNELSEIVVRRFKTTLALLFSDIVKSTEYFGRFGNEAGRKLQQRHFDLLDQIVRQHGGRIVDTAGDGGFSCFATAEQAAEASVQLQLALCKENIHRERDTSFWCALVSTTVRFSLTMCSLPVTQSISARAWPPAGRVQRSALPGKRLRSWPVPAESAAEPWPR